MHLDIDGIDVIFPFDFIYPEQISYMRELKYRSGIFNVLSISKFYRFQFIRESLKVHICDTV